MFVVLRRVSVAPTGVGAGAFSFLGLPPLLGVSELELLRRKPTATLVSDIRRSLSFLRWCMLSFELFG
jgi:hypothetical protein